ncbi:carbonic anhydrase 14-like, partial [Oppia nitens]|uniref:carbonic anhydrase 14-like n=1 Tax=Oppia nitens TaxID=1686743 RepID=UPI0023D9F30A
LNSGNNTECNGPTFAYKDKTKWSVIFPGCGADRQSPINIDRQLAVYLPELKLIFYNYMQTYDWEVLNNGETVQLMTRGIVGPVLDLRDSSSGGGGGAGGGVATSDRYHFYSALFHWGQSDDDQGSEHSIDNKFASAELYITHYNEKYGNMDNAVPYDDGMLILSTMFTIADDKPQVDNPDLSPLIQLLPDVITLNVSTLLFRERPFYLGQLMPQNKTSMFKYQGSITFPPCHQSVTWIIFDEPLPISRAQQNKL